MPIVALYDEQCELCQASAAWARLLDRRGGLRCVPVQSTDLASIHPDLHEDECLRTLHAVTDDGRVLTSWEAVKALWSSVPFGRPLIVLTERARWAERIGRAVTERLLDSRWELVQARGGQPDDHLAPRPFSPLGPFWLCYSTEMVLRLPVVAWATLHRLAGHVIDWVRTRGRSVALLDGKLTICFLSGFPTAVVPLLFGERFTLAVYDGVAVDPGSVRMRKSIERHLAKLVSPIRSIVPTHAHEEHVGNLSWLSRRTGAPVFTSFATAALLRPPYLLPWTRRAVIGPIAPLEAFDPLGTRLPTSSGELLVLPAPGHSDDHVVLFDPVEGVLLAGDSFMGEHFATPNDDVDADAWIATLERLERLHVTVLVEAHGHVHTQRADVPDIPGVVIRDDPMDAIARKLENLRWLRDRVARGRADEMSDAAVEATCFPWGPRWSWERKGTDELARLLTGGRFSRTQVVRSFRHVPGELFPDRREVRFST